WVLFRFCRCNRQVLMSIARKIYDFEQKLREQRIDVFSPKADISIAHFPESEIIIRHLIDQRFPDPNLALLMSLQCLRIQFSEIGHKVQDAEFVATLPKSVPGVARPTAQVIREMIESSKKEVILLGYDLSERFVLESLINT